MQQSKHLVCTVSTSAYNEDTNPFIFWMPLLVYTVFSWITIISIVDVRCAIYMKCVRWKRIFHFLISRFVWLQRRRMKKLINKIPLQNNFMSTIEMHFLKLKNVDPLTFTQKLAILIDSSLFVFAITIELYKQSDFSITTISFLQHI